MLDRIDALLFAAPLLWYYAAWRVMHSLQVADYVVRTE